MRRAIKLLEVDAVLFDMDGTLVDESASYCEAIRLTAEYILRDAVSADEVAEIKRLPGFNNDWDATWALVGQRLHGRVLAPTDVDRASQAFRRLQHAFQTFYLGDRLWAQIAGIEPPFTWSEPLMLRETLLVDHETLRVLSGYTLGIATSRPRREALMAARQHGLDRFFDAAAIVAAEDAAFQKPHPAPLHLLVSRLGCRRPVYIGDSISDAIAAFEAGIPFVAVGDEPFRLARWEERVHTRVQRVNEILELCAPAGTRMPGREAHG